jgi:hypothetical protein
VLGLQVGDLAPQLAIEVALARLARLRPLGLAALGVELGVAVAQVLVAQLELAFELLALLLARPLELPALALLRRALVGARLLRRLGRAGVGAPLRLPPGREAQRAAGQRDPEPPERGLGRGDQRGARCSWSARAARRAPR